MKDHTDRVTTSCPNAAYTMSKIHSIHAPGALDGTMMDCECYSIASTERDHLGARLHARALLRNHELAPREIPVWLRQQDRDLKRKDMLAV